MNTEKVEQKLQTRGLNQTVFAPIDEDEGWVVWLWAPDDPGLGVFVGDGGTYDEALRQALQRFDEHQKVYDAPEEQETVNGGSPS